MRARPWLWPNHVIGKRESEVLRDEHNGAVNEAAELLDSCRKLLTRLEREGISNVDIEEARGRIARAEA